MAIYYAGSTGGFYDSAIHGSGIPSDAVKISQDRYQELLNLQNSGQTIAAGEDGGPIAINEPPTAPTRCTPAQGLVALFALKNITEDNVLAAIAQIPDPVQQYTAKIGYQRATTWERGSPTMQAMALLLQLSEQDLDALFGYAVEVQV